MVLWRSSNKTLLFAAIARWLHRRGSVSKKR
jgi:hypothetical protein